MAIEIISTPSRKLSLNNPSLWGAAFNPQVFELKRKDFVVDVIDDGDPGELEIVLPFSSTLDELNAIIGSKIYIKSAHHDYTATVLNASSSISNTALYVETDGNSGFSDATGYVNIPALRPGYKVQTTITLGAPSVSVFGVQNPVVASTNSSVYTYIFNLSTPFGLLNRVHVYALASGTLKIKQFRKSVDGLTFFFIGQVTVSVVAGVNHIDTGALTFLAGDYIGFYSTVSIRNQTGAGAYGYYFKADGSDISSDVLISDLGLGNTAVIQIGFEFSNYSTSNSIVTRHTPDIKGNVRIDLQAYLKAFTNSNDEAADYNIFSWLDQNRFERYKVTFAEFYSNTAQAGALQPENYYITHSALQFNPYGSSMAEYTPFAIEPNTDKLAKFLTHIKQPVFTPGYPFDLSFIKGEELSGKTIYCRYATLDINRNAIQGFASSELLLNTVDRIKINEADNFNITDPVYSVIVAATYPGVWRLPMIDSLTPAVAFVEVYLYYLNTSGEAIRVSEIKSIKVNKENCRPDEIYIKWLNLLGGWDYGLFDYRSEYSVDVTQAFVDRLVFDYATQNATQDVLSKTGLEKIRIGKIGVTAEGMQALKGLLLSTKVYRLTSFSSRLWQTVVVDTKGTTLYDTQDWFGDFETTLKLPSLNIQTA